MPATALPLLGNHHILGTQHSFFCELQCYNAGQAATAVWPTANLAIYVPVYADAPNVYNQIFWLNGTVVSAPSMEVALYNAQGTVKLATSGVVTQVGSGAPQAVTLAGGLYLPRGRYWMGMVLGNNTSGINRWTAIAAMVSGFRKALGVAEETRGATTLPAAITFGAAANDYVPVMGLIANSLAV